MGNPKASLGKATAADASMDTLPFEQLQLIEGRPMLNAELETLHALYQKAATVPWVAKFASQLPSRGWHPAKDVTLKGALSAAHRNQWTKGLLFHAALFQILGIESKHVRAGLPYVVGVARDSFLTIHKGALQPRDPLQGPQFLPIVNAEIWASLATNQDPHPILEKSVPKRKRSTMLQSDSKKTSATSSGTSQNPLFGFTRESSRIERTATASINGQLMPTMLPRDRGLSSGMDDRGSLHGGRIGSLSSGPCATFVNLSDVHPADRAQQQPLLQGISSHMWPTDDRFESGLLDGAFNFRYLPNLGDLHDDLPAKRKAPQTRSRFGDTTALEEMEQALRYPGQDSDADPGYKLGYSMPAKVGSGSHSSGIERGAATRARKSTSANGDDKSDLERLQSVYHQPINLAAKELGMGVTVLKKLCRVYGIERWPYRKLSSLDKLITSVKQVNVRSATSGCSFVTAAAAAAWLPAAWFWSIIQAEDPGDTYNEQALLVLQEQRKSIFKNPAQDLDEWSKKFRQANFKQQYKVRQQLPPEYQGQNLPQLIKMKEQDDSS